MTKKSEKANLLDDKYQVILKKLNAKLPHGSLSAIHERLSRKGTSPSISTIRLILKGELVDKYNVIQEAIALSKEIHQSNEQKAGSLIEQLIESGLYNETDFQTQNS